MTREEIERMTGAEVDEYLAERVMEWKLGTSNIWVAPDDSMTSAKYWDPYYDLNRAMQAAEKVGLVLEGRHFDLMYASDGWVASWLDCTAARGYPWANAPTPALAVCRAVIMANEAK